MKRPTLPARLHAYALAGMALFLSPPQRAAAETARRPNVLLICVDDLKPVLGCYGNKTVKSPNIDRLAARGVVFDYAYCNQAVCAPSRNSLLSGVRPSSLGVYDLGTNFRTSVPDTVTLPQHFKEQGWRSEAVGKIFHVGHGNFDDVQSWSVESVPGKSIEYAVPASHDPKSLTREEALFSNQSAENLPRGAAWENPDVPDESYSDGRLAAEAVKRLRAAKEQPEAPFFLALGFVKPHLPFCAPKKYWDLYDESAFALAERRTPPDGAPAYAPQNSGELRQYSGMPDSGPIPDSAQRSLIHGYHAAVSFMDAQLGKVLDEVDRLGLADSTIILLWGDHGWHLGDHGMWCKHTNYEEAARIPLIIAAPGVSRPGAHARAMVETIDLYPTLNELAGLPAPQRGLPLEGRSLVPFLRDPDFPGKDHIMHVYPRNKPGTGPVIGRALRTATHRLVEWKAPGAAPETADLELYDYAGDPGETRNLASSQPELAARLRGMLAEYGEARPQISGGQSRPKLFAKKDANGDGKLSREEFMNGQPDPPEAAKRFLRFDLNKDGELSREEFVTQGNPAPGGKPANPASDSVSPAPSPAAPAPAPVPSSR